MKKTISTLILLSAIFALCTLQSCSDKLEYDGDKFVIADIIDGIKDEMTVEIDAGGDELVLKTSVRAWPVFYSNVRFEKDNIIDCINSWFANNPNNTYLESKEFIEVFNNQHEDSKIFYLRDFNPSLTHANDIYLTIEYEDPKSYYPTPVFNCDGLEMKLNFKYTNERYSFYITISADSRIAGETRCVQLAGESWGLGMTRPLILNVIIK